MAKAGGGVTLRSAQAWALAYAALGWRVFPVVPGGKRPLFPGWQRDATTDPQLIGRYWRSEPGPNIGLICGEAFDAYDVERPHLRGLAEWMGLNDYRMPTTPIARTGRGGVHILVRAGDAPGHALRLRGARIGELKARGGFIVACPSRTTGDYWWHRAPEDASLDPAPPWLRSLVATTTRADQADSKRTVGPARGEPRLAALARAVRGSREGTRNDVLYWAMRRALDDGIPASVASTVLARMAAEAGLEDREISATIGSARGALAR